MREIKERMIRTASYIQEAHPYVCARSLFRANSTVSPANCLLFKCLRRFFREIRISRIHRTLVASRFSRWSIRFKIEPLSEIIVKANLSQCAKIIG